MKNSRKIFLAMWIALILVIAVTAPAMAAPGVAPDSPRFMDDNAGVMDNFTLDMLATTGGMAVVAAALVQATKKFLLKTDPKWLALGWSLVLNGVYIFVLAQDRSASVIITAVLNVPFVAVAASGAYEYGIKALQNKLIQSKEAKAQGNSTTDEGGGNDE